MLRRNHLLAACATPSLLVLLLLVALAEAPAGTEPPARPRPLDCTSAEGVSAKEVKRAQRAWSKHLGRMVEEEVEIVGGVKMTFVLVPPGKFKMGSPEDEKDREDDETLHMVTLTQPFYLGKYEVT